MNKICFITGANSGIGKESAIQMAELGYYVLVGARNVDRGNRAVEEIKMKAKCELVELIVIDLSSQESIKAASQSIKSRFKHLDVLIQNAADFDIARKSPLKTVDGIESVWATNHIGPVLLTELLLPLLHNSRQGRIITVASQGLMLHPNMKIEINDPEYKLRKFSVANAYYQSKLAQVMYTYWLAKELAQSAITVNCVRVTNVKIDISRYPNLSPFMKWMYSIKSKFSITPETMARAYTYLATSSEVNYTTGKYFDQNNKIVPSSAYSQNSDNISALMLLTRNYLKE